MTPYLYQLHDRETVPCDRHDHIDGDGRGVGIEWGEYVVQCCQDGEAICVQCGDLAVGMTGDNEPACGPHLHEWEREFGDEAVRTPEISEVWT